MTLLSVILPIVIFTALCAACCRLCRSSNTNTNTHTVIVEPPAGADSTSQIPSSAPLVGDPGSIQGPPTGPSASMQDLPPAYDTVINDPSQFAFPPGQIGSDGGAIPLTPPPDYIPPQQVDFSAARSDNDMVTQSSTDI